MKRIKLPPPPAGLQQPADGALAPAGLTRSSSQRQPPAAPAAVAGVSLAEFQALQAAVDAQGEQLSQLASDMAAVREAVGSITSLKSAIKALGSEVAALKTGAGVTLPSDAERANSARLNMFMLHGFAGSSSYKRHPHT